MVIICSSEKCVARNQGLLLKFFQSQDLAFSINTLNKDVIKVLSGKHFLYRYLLLIILFHFELLKVNVSLCIIPLNLQLAEVFMFCVRRHYAHNFTN